MAGPLLNSCAQVPITDHEFCGSLGTQGAYCSHLLTNQSRTLTLEQFGAYWTDLNDPKVATELSTITEWKGDIEKLCTISQDCSAQIQSQVNALYIKVSTAHAAMSKALGK